MPAITTGSGARAVLPRQRRRKQPAEPANPNPRGATGAFGGASSQRPLAQQQRQQAARTRAAVRRLPVPVIATPPIISSPTRKQTEAARAQIVKSIRANVAGSSGAVRVARTDQLLDQIRTDPRLARARRSIAHYAAAESSLNTPDSRLRNLRDRITPGRAPSRARLGVGPFSLATVNLTAASQAARNAVAAAAPGLGSGSAEAQFARNALKDVGSLAEAPFVAGIALGGVGADVVTGHPGRAADKTAAFGKGIVQSTVHEVTHPGQALREHPLLTALDLLGAASVAGHIGGAVVRGAGSTVEAGGIRGALARAGSTARSPIALVDDPAAAVGGNYVERTFSKDLGRKGAQSLSDATRDVVRHPDGSPVMVRQRGRLVPLLQPRSELERAYLAKQRGDFLASRANLSERLERAQAAPANTVRTREGAAARTVAAKVGLGEKPTAAGVRGRAARDVVAMVAEGTITTAAHFGDELRARLSVIRANLAQHDRSQHGQGVSPYADLREVVKARKEADTISRVLHSPKALAQADRIVQAGTEIGRRQVAAEREAVAQGLFTGGAEQATRRRLSVPAIAHQGAYHGRSAALTARAAQLRSVERGLQARLNFGHHGNDPALRVNIQRQLETARRLRRDVEARNTERLRGPDGRPIDPHHVEAFLRDRGRDPDTVAFLPHRGDSVGSAAFHSQFRPGGRPRLDKAGQTFKGERYARGAQGTSAELLQQQGVRQQVQLSKARQIDRLIGDHGIKHPATVKFARGEGLTKHERRVVAQGGYFTGPEAQKLIDRADADKGQRLVAVTGYAQGLDASMREIIRDDYQGPGGMESLGQRLLNNRFLSEQELKSGRARNVVLVNRDLIDRLNKHLAPSGPGKRFAQIINRAFRYAVLPQPRWLGGNFFESFIVRLTVTGSGLNLPGLALDLRATSKAIRSMQRSGDPRVRAAARELQAQQIDSGLFVGGRGATQHRGLSDFPVLDATTKRAYARMVERLPATRHFAELTGLLLRNGGKAVLAPLDTFFAINRAIENTAQRAAFGHQLRKDIQEWTGSWMETVRLGQKAVEEAAGGHVNTPTQHRFMTAQHELLGKYDGYGPTMRGIIQGPAPFLPWALNAMRFVFWTMPAHHTAVTALLVKVNQAVEKDWRELHSNLPPGGLRLAIPNGKGGWIDIARYTPYGLTGPVAEGDPQALTSQFYPQVSGASQAIQGKSPFGQDLQVSSGESPVPLGKRLLIALNEAGEATVPYASTIRRLREGGNTALADSTVVSPRVKEGTAYGRSAVQRVFDPLSPTYLGAPSASDAGPRVAAPVSRREQLLTRRAALLDARAAQGARAQELLERRARLLASR